MNPQCKKHTTIQTHSSRAVGSNFTARENVSDQLLIQREVRCQLIRVAFQYNRVGSAIEPGHVDGVARCGVGIDHIVNNHLTCLVFNHQFGLTDRLTPLNRHLRAKHRCIQCSRRYRSQRHS